MTRRVCCAAVAVLVSFSLVTTRAELRAAEPAAASPAAWMPPSTVAYAEIREPGKLLGQVLKHPALQKVKSLDAYKQATLNPKFIGFRLVVGVVEHELGMKWHEAFAGLTEGGVYAGFDAKTQGLVIIAKARDEATLHKIRDTFFKLAKADAKRKEKPGPPDPVKYRGADVYDFGQMKAATVGPFLMLTNKKELGKHVLDARLDGAETSLAAVPAFRKARAAAPQGAAAWAFLNAAVLKHAGVTEKMKAALAQNPAAELLAGGVVEALKTAPYVAGSLHLDDKSLRLTLTAPHDRTSVSKEREYFLGPKGAAEAPPLLEPNGALATATAHRDIHGMWRLAPELFTEKINAQFVQAEGQFKTLFAGADFVDEILAALGPRMQIVAIRQNYTGGVKPAIKLPAGGVVFELKEPEKIKRRLKVSFQSAMGLLNIASAQQGGPQFELKTTSRGKATIYSAEYLPPDEGNTTDAAIQYNFSPAIAFVRDRFIVATTREAAERLVDAVAQASAKRGDSAVRVNTALRLDAAVLAEVLQDNRAQLIAQNMLKEGNTKKQAAGEIDGLLSILGLFDHAEAKLVTTSDQMQLHVSVTFATKD